MDGRRTYLDSLNAGRQRRVPNPLDDLNRSLERLGERLDRRDHAPRRGPLPAYEQPRWPAREERAPMPPPRSPRREDVVPPRDDAYMATTGRLAAEVKGLRDELRQQMTVGLQREFESLRGDIARAYSASGSGGAGLADELEQISESIQTLSSRSDDRGINLLRLDIEQLRSELDALAREETVRSMDSRWDEFDQRWHALEHHMEAHPASDAGIQALNDRLQQITEAVNNLPESLSLKSLEDKVRTLAGSVDQFSQQDGRAPQLFATIEQRLDEISRAIVASASATQAANLDFESIQRIEGRISSLARQLDELSNAAPSAEILDRLNALSMRIDEVARHSEVPARSVEKLASQIAIIADRIDSGSSLADADAIMRGLENRFEQFAGVMERRQDTALEANHAMFRDLETRLHDVISRLDQHSDPAPDNTGLMEAIDARLADFSHRLEARKADLLGDSSIRDLEAKIDTISSRFDEAPAAPQVDPEAIRNLEAQIAGLSAFLSKPEQPAPADTISPRLEQMEKAIRGNRDMVIDAARRAAEDVVRSFAGSPTDAGAVAGLTQDLKSLETLTKRSDERNSKTFEAIHDTLLKIVDRLSTIENPDTVQTVPAVAAKVSIKEAPSIAPTEIGAEDGEATPRVEADDAAIAAMVAAPTIDEAEAAPEQGKRRSMFSGFGRAFAGRKKAEEAPAEAAGVGDAVAEAPKLDLDEPLDPKIANRPLQPGSGAPDLSRIIKRVREERAQQEPAKSEDADAARSDFIAAARRAAQAAAAEAEVLKRHSDIAGASRGFKLGELLKARRKPILMGAAAVMIALAGLQLGKALLSDSNVVTGGNLNAGPAEVNMAVVETAQETAALQPAGDAEGAAPEATAPEAQTEAPLDGLGDETAFSPDEIGEAATDEPVGATFSEGVTAPPETVDLNDTITASVTPQERMTPEQPETAAPVAELPAAPADAGPTALREAADAGDPKAIFEIGARYSEGRGTKADNEKAAEWYERSAELGLAPAQYRIGNMYEKGIGVERDLTKAKTWYQMAAEQGNASAMHNLAVLYAMGTDGTTDNESAGRWFNRAAELGVKDSQFNLGILNAKGVGMPQNLEESYKWFALVAGAGDRDAAAKRDEIANSLRPEQLERARAAAELWKAKPVDATANVVDIPEEWQESQEQTASVDMEKAVKTIQLILNKNGYDAGGADGVMGQKTRNAIISFQKDNGLPADGEVTEKLVQELLARK